MVDGVWRWRSFLLDCFYKKKLHHWKITFQPKMNSLRSLGCALKYPRSSTTLKYSQKTHSSHVIMDNILIFWSLQWIVLMAKKLFGFQQLAGAIKTLGLILFMYIFSISLTFYNRWLLQVCGKLFINLLSLSLSLWQVKSGLEQSKPIFKKTLLFSIMEIYMWWSSLVTISIFAH